MRHPKDETIEIKTSSLRMTPNDAARVLDAKAKNRPLAPARIARLAYDMRAGLWYTSPQGLVFARGVLVDGQHRLAAQVSAGVELEWSVAHWDVDPDAAIRRLDKGRPRTTAQNLSIGGVDRAATVVAALKIHWALSCGDAETPSVILQGAPKLTEERFYLYLGDNEDTVAWIQSHPRKARVWTATVIGTLAWARECDWIGKETVDAFASQLRDGGSIAEPVARLRDWLMTTASSGGQHQWNSCHKTLHALSKYANGESCGRLSVSLDVYRKIWKSINKGLER